MARWTERKLERFTGGVHTQLDQVVGARMGTCDLEKVALVSTY